MTAMISEDLLYRYVLTRQIDTPPLRVGEPSGIVVFVGLNPSTADSRVDDPTIRRCKRFAADWGYSQLTMLNLYAYRSPYPQDLRRVGDPIGPLNDETLREHLPRAELVIAAWGATVRPERALEVMRLTDVMWHCLGVTKTGAPRHPLYIPAETRPRPFEPAA